MTLGARNAEEDLTRTLLYQGKMLVESLDQERFLLLTATAADEQSPYYHELRNMLIRMRAANPTYRYIYLMGRKGDGPPFFYMGTAPSGTDEYSPPGQLYTEEAPALAHVFATEEATVSDLVTDRWGTWVSVLVPLHDRSTGRMLAVFGMDIDTRNWLKSIWLRAILPGVLTLTLVTLLLMLYLVFRNQQRIKIQRILFQNNNVLRESERKIRAVLDQSHQLIGLMTTEGILIDMNRTALAYLGTNESDVLNRPFSETSWWSHSTELQERLRVAITEAAAGEFVGFEATHFTVDGDRRIIDFSLSPVKDETGKVLFIIPQGYDITEARRTEAAVRASEERLSLALDAANDGLWDWDVNSGEAFFSPRYYTMLGYEPGGFEASYAEWRNRVHPDDQARVETLLSRYLEKEEPAFEVEFRFRDKAGGWRWVLARGKAVGWSQEGRITRMVGTHVDINERKRAEEALEKSRDELEARVTERTRELTEANARLTELDSLKSTFLNTVSHDLRTPLTSILGFSKIIKRDFTRHFIPLTEADKALRDKASKILDNLGVIGAEGERLTRLVSDFLDLSRIEEGRYAWKDKKMDMGILIENTVSSLKGALFQNPGVQVRLDIAPNLPELCVDPDRITQVLTNLLSNAIKFTPKGTVTLTATATLENLRVSVADSGIGIPLEELPKVFDKFYQVGKDTLLAEKGTGLGLAICKQIVRHYDGTIWAESTVGVGSIFSFEIPLSPSSLKP